jgi:hypothetical protein
VAVNYPAAVLEKLHGGDGFNFVHVARYLRSLRFDVRLFETNKTIPVGYFRCCYPFVLSANRQVSVSWKDHADGNVPVVRDRSRRVQCRRRLKRESSANSKRQ